MAGKKPNLTVRLAPRASRHLTAIYLYNLETRGLRAADRYFEFLEGKIKDLATRWHLGRQVSDRPSLSYIVAKVRPGGAGHIIVYSVDPANEALEIAGVFHTKQAWQEKI